VIAEVLHWACKEWGKAEAVRRSEEVFESGSPKIWMASSKKRKMRDGIEIPVWEGEFPADLMRDVIKEQFRACSDQKAKSGARLPKPRPGQRIAAPGGPALLRDDGGDFRFSYRRLSSALQELRDRSRDDDDSG
jgi:hypothetical protein